MHRSGTSSLTGTLSECGVRLGPINLKGTGNPKGNLEIKEVWQLNEELMKQFGGTWMSPQKVLTWSRSHTEKKKHLLENFQGVQPYVIKDPRLMFTLEFWLEELSLPPVLLGCFRHPTAVVNSLSKRNNLDESISLQVWKDYNLRLLEIIIHYGVSLVSFDVPAESYTRRVTSLLKQFKFQLPDQLSFFEDSLRNISDITQFPDKESEKIYLELEHNYLRQLSENDS